MTLSARQLEDLRDRRKAIAAGGGGDKIAQRHAKGLMTARERLLALFQPDTYQEAGMHIRHRGYQLGEHKNDMPVDGVITGTGYVHGQPAVSYTHLDVYKRQPPHPAAISAIAATPTSAVRIRRRFDLSTFNLVPC